MTIPVRRHVHLWRGLKAIFATCAIALTLSVQAVGLGGIAAAQTENLLDRISNQRMQSFEERLTRVINAALGQYISQSQYVLSVKVLWNQNILPAVNTPGLAPDKQKLPGFPIFVRSPDAPNVDQSTPPFVRMIVQVLLDETLPEYYERFVRKIVPIVARFDNNRGDQVVVVKETFPALPKGVQPSTLPEKELMEQLGEKFPEALRPAQPQVSQVLPSAALQPQLPLGRQEAAGPTASLEEQVRIAFDESRYTDALRIVQTGFQTSTTNPRRAGFLGMEGSLYYVMDNHNAALASWKRAVVFDPSNRDIHQALNFLESQRNGSE